jgi:hypothetical protein
MHSILPSAKLIILLRDPVKRAVSEFRHHCRHGRYIRLTRPIIARFHSFHGHLDGVSEGRILLNDIVTDPAVTGSVSERERRGGREDGKKSRKEDERVSGDEEKEEEKEKGEKEKEVTEVSGVSSSIRPLTPPHYPSEEHQHHTNGTALASSSSSTSQLSSPLSSVTSGRDKWRISSSVVHLPAGSVMPLAALEEIIGQVSESYCDRGRGRGVSGGGNSTLHSTSPPSSTSTSSPSPPSLLVSGMWKANRKDIEASYVTLSYPCSSADFRDYYFGHPTDHIDLNTDSIPPNALVLAPPVSSSSCTVLEQSVRGGERGGEKGAEKDGERGMKKGVKKGAERGDKRGGERRLERVTHHTRTKELPHKAHRFLPSHLSEEEASHSFYGSQLEGVLAR